jgi:hypothetical protein
MAPAVGGNICLQDLYRRKTCFLDAVEGIDPLRRTQDLGSDDLRLARQFFDRHEHLMKI